MGAGVGVGVGAAGGGAPHLAEISSKKQITSMVKIFSLFTCEIMVVLTW